MAHGMLSAGLLGSFLTRWFGPGSVRRLKVRFRERVWPGDTLTARGRVTAVRDGRVALELELLRQDGVQVITGSAEVAL
jgi:acyl dehydratase